MGVLIYVMLMIMLLIKIFKPKYTEGVTLIFANIGTGKTTLISKLVQEEKRKIAKGKSKFKYIVSNAQISGVIYVEDIRKLIREGALEDTLILIDEGSIVYNNRKQNMTEAEIQYFKYIRHYRSACTVVSQSYDDIDVTLRRLYTKMYLLNKLPYITLIRPIKKKVGIDQVTKQIIDQYSYILPFAWRIFARPKYYKFFNSWWVPANVPIHDLRLYEEMPGYKGRTLKERLMTLYRKEEIEKEEGEI